MQRLFQRAARAFGVAFGPEQREQTIAGHGSVGGENGQQDQRLAVAAQLRDRLSVELDGKASERAQ